MNFKTTTLLLGIFTVGILHAQHREIQFESGKWASVLEKSAKENKMIYLDCYASWCGPCKWMAKNVFKNDTAADFYNSNFVNVEIDMEKGEGIELAKKYGIQAYPTMLYLNSSGEVMHRTCGSSTVSDFVKSGKDALNPDKRLSAMVKKFNHGVNPEITPSAYFSVLEKGCQDFESELNAYFGTLTPEQLTERKNWEIINKFVYNYSSKAFAAFENNRKAFEEKYSSDSVKSKLNDVYAEGLSQSIRNKDEDTFQALKTKVKNLGSMNAERIMLNADMQLYETNGDWKNYAQTASVYADTYLTDNASALNGVAWTFYEHIDDHDLLLKAEKWAKRAVELQNIYATNDTYAAVLYKLGRKEEAKKTALKAISMAKENGENYSETESLLEKIEKLKTAGK